MYKVWRLFETEKRIAFPWRFNSQLADVNFSSTHRRHGPKQNETHEWILIDEKEKRKSVFFTSYQPRKKVRMTFVININESGSKVNIVKEKG